MMKRAERRVPWQSSITEVREDSLITRGLDQREIIRNFSYEEMIFLLLLGRRPTSTEATLLRTVLVSHMSHGITGQSTLAVMQAADCRSEFLHALVAGFSVGSGKYHQGGLRATMSLLQELVVLSASQLRSYVYRALDRGDHVMGFGHRFHKRDPRAQVIMDVAKSLNFSGPHTGVALQVEQILHERKGIYMNIEAAGGSLLLDLGFDPRVAHLFIILGRSPMYAAVYLERLQCGLPPFPRIEVVDVLEVTDNDSLNA